MVDATDTAVEIQISPTYRCLTEKRAIHLQAALRTVSDCKVLRSRRGLWWEISVWQRENQAQ